MKVRFHYNPIIMIVCSVLFFASILLGSGCCKNPADNDEPDSVTDIDGNEYAIIRIGDQWWMAENLRVTHYRNGDEIPNVTVNAEWAALSTGACCSYDNTVNNREVYGLLYNWYAVNDIRNIAPKGWHVPTDEEWKQLEMFLGMTQSDADGTGLRGTDEGGKLKEAGTTHWVIPNEGATNETGFTALPGGSRDTLGSFYSMGHWTYFWCSTQYDLTEAYARSLYYSTSIIYRGSEIKGYAQSVRCIKDN